MSADLAVAPVDHSTIETVLATGDLARLTPQQRVSHYVGVCESLGLNWRTQPFAYIALNGKLVLYARKDAADQLRATRKISIAIVARDRGEDVYVVTARATTPDGRSDESTGVVTTARLTGEHLANALMKAETKAKRRVTLSICGLGFLDETETEAIPGGRTVAVAQDGTIAEPAPVAPMRRALPAPAAEDSYDDPLIALTNTAAACADLGALRERAHPVLKRMIGRHPERKAELVAAYEARKHALDCPEPPAEREPGDDSEEP